MTLSRPIARRPEPFQEKRSAPLRDAAETEPEQRLRLALDGALRQFGFVKAVRGKEDAYSLAPDPQNPLRSTPIARPMPASSAPETPARVP